MLSDESESNKIIIEKEDGLEIKAKQVVAMINFEF
jgi:hypothetical protein